MSGDSQKAALITGGSSGIGLALAHELLVRGYDVAICGRDPAKLAAAKQSLSRIHTIEADVAHPDDHTKLEVWLNMNMPHVNVLVNNAGVQRTADYRSGVSAKAIRQEIDINLFGPLALTATLLSLLLRNADPAIVNVTSGLAFCPIAEIPVYCATKAALHSFTVSLRHQLHGRARVIELAPPMVATDLDQANRRHESKPRGISAQEFASEAVARFERGETEIVVGHANTLRQRGEAMFSTMNASAQQLTR